MTNPLSTALTLGVLDLIGAALVDARYEKMAGELDQVSSAYVLASPILWKKICLTWSPAFRLNSTHSIVPCTSLSQGRTAMLSQTAPEPEMRWPWMMFVFDPPHPPAPLVAGQGPSDKDVGQLNMISWSKSEGRLATK